MDADEKLSLLKGEIVTVPWLMNCGHCASAWCLKCVRELAEERNALMDDAERYRKIKDNRSPFMLRYYGSRILGGDEQRRDVLTPELDALIDSWPEPDSGDEWPPKSCPPITGA